MRIFSPLRLTMIMLTAASLVGCSGGTAIVPKPAPHAGAAGGATFDGQLNPAHTGPGALAWSFDMLVSFNGTDGNGPYAALVQATDGNLYGTTSEGGTGFIAGTVFKMTPTGTLLTLYSFQGSDGFNPTSSLIQAANGDLYGTTEGGGASTACQFGCGTVFRITTGGAFKRLHSFDLTDGAYPYGGLVQAKNGDFYGTTSYGGAHSNYGTVFKITPRGKLTTLHSFDGSDGSQSMAALVQASDGNFYGTTEVGANSYGTVFKMTPSGKLTTLHAFKGTDGGFPTAGLIQAADRKLYGTTEYGQYHGDLSGTVFKITLRGTFTSLHTFNQTDGANPYGGLVQATDGKLYGTTLNGGVNNYGAVFKITTSGAFSTIYSFQNSQAYPFAGVMQAANGKLYGTTYEGGIGNCDGFFCGMVYSLTKP
jgi:uncharacterized repeat protein (TIGR03803 family)